MNESNKCKGWCNGGSFFSSENCHGPVCKGNTVIPHHNKIENWNILAVAAWIASAFLILVLFIWILPVKITVMIIAIIIVAALYLGFSYARNT